MSIRYRLPAPPTLSVLPPAVLPAAVLLAAALLAATSAAGATFYQGASAVARQAQASQPGQATVLVAPGTDAPAPQIRVLDQNAHGLTLEFELPALVVEDMNVGGEIYQAVSIPDGGLSGQTGAPIIPVFNRFLYAPEGAAVRVTETGRTEDEIDGVRLIPMQDEDGPGFAFDPAAYSRNDFGIEPSAKVGGSAHMRNLTVRPITFAPVRYNPAEGKLRVARRLEVRIDFDGANLTAPFAGQTRPVARTFDRLYRQLVVNYDGPAAGVTVADGTWLCICPNNAGVLALLQPLADWHHRQGLPVRIATTAETGTTTTAIQAYLQNAYDTWADPPEFVALAADVSAPFAIPCYFYGGGATDQAYSQLDGSDLIPDVNLGRLSYADTTQLRVIVTKSIGYAQTPSLSDPNWFLRATLAGDPGASGFSTVQVMQWIKTRLRQIGYTGIDTIFSGSFVSQMATSLNRGETVFSYRGFVGMSGWQNTNTNNLTNFWKLPFAVISTCGTGDFDGTSYTEAFLRAGTAAQPKGAIGSIGTSTLETHTRYNNCLTMGVHQGLLYEDLWEMGAALTRGKVELVLNYNQADPSHCAAFCNWNNLMGDPACQIWTGFPAPITATYPNPIPIGASSFPIHVAEQDGSNCVGAQVCLWKGTEIYAVALTDSQGNCELPISALNPGSAKLTVTKHNRYPVVVDVPVFPQANFVGYLASALDDDAIGESQGNGDGQAEPGETVELRVELQNFGSATANLVTAQMTSDDPYVTIVDGSEDYGTMNPGAAAWSPDDFDFTISPGTPDGHQIRLGIDISSDSGQWHALVVVPVISADLTSSGVTIYDPNNSRLDPGESQDIAVALHNEGGTTAQSTGAVLTSFDQFITVLDGLANYGTITVGQTVLNSLDHFRVGASAATFPGHLSFLQLVSTFNNGATDTTMVPLTVGQAVTTDPVGPDPYGYYAFDNTDTSYPDAPVYNWIEIDAGLGGPGTQVQLGDFASYQDKSRGVDLPFTFRFYGQSFNRATICSNGWIAMGDTYLTDYRNWTIPGAGAPQNLIAAFWDDLQETNSGGHVFQWYDSANHRWIVEWSRMRNEVNLVTETVEAILYDPAFHPTGSGDGMIEFQYNTVSNVDGVDGYATVGIQNWNHTVGLLYTYYNRYPGAAAPLAAGRAIRILPVSVDLTGAEQTPRVDFPLALDPALPNPFGANTAIGFSLPSPGSVRLAVYDTQGRRIRSLISGQLPAGKNMVRWDGRDDQGRSVPAGIYFSRMEAAGKTLARKMMRIE